MAQSTLLPLPYLLPPNSTGISPYVTDARRIILPWKPIEGPCPVDDSNRDAWTEFHRNLAEHRYIPKNLDDLEEKVHRSCGFHCPHRYLINSFPDP